MTEVVLIDLMLWSSHSSRWAGLLRTGPFFLVTCRCVGKLFPVSDDPFDEAEVSAGITSSSQPQPPRS